MSARRTSWADDPRLARLAHLPIEDPSSWPTRERILYAAGHLMATKGFHGATTRDIAEAVGIQQPSIFNHFANKTAIIATLFEYDQVIPAERLAAIARDGGSPGCQLYRYVEWQTAWYLDLPFDMRGLREETIVELELAEAQRAMRSFRRTLNRIIKTGVDSGQFAPEGHDFLYPALDALGWEACRMSRNLTPTAEHRRLREAATSFVLRATLTDPGSLAMVRDEAAAVAARVAD